ncbi:hypothetical protein RZO55_12000 [Clostridium boliviensis]|uniref:Uncharacterized protein n=1 Tax=Clostridium boliviensis TaxID=318465 RepID=A0ABU4GL04_9CLOT|nr:hypothetical protein [Clostridium boliviensis]MDW2798296.1 hypothetical protein [Clostridium boliviensis]
MVEKAKSERKFTETMVIQIGPLHRICHLWEGTGVISFGVYACSPEASSFKAVFTHMEVMECMWKEHK